MVHRIFILSALITINIACLSQSRDFIDSALTPFWKTATMHNESVLMVSSNGRPPEAKLLFAPEKILSVRNSALDTAYQEGVDWEYTQGRLKLLNGFKGAVLSNDQLYPDSASSRAFPRKGGGFILFSEGSFFHEHQLAVTYTHAPNLWKGPVPSFQSKTFRGLISKLKRQSTLKLLLFGNSIAAGFNGSKQTNASPYLPGWGELIAEKLRRFYKGEIEFVNTAVAGTDSHWGVRTAEERIIKYDPDLVIIAFGMNDGTARMEPKQFKANIQEIINKVKQHNPKAAFILVAPMLPNPESEFVGTQPAFKKVLQELTGNRIALADMTTVHAELLEHKTYQDMTGNNINHPNDFLIRWYAQQIIGLLIPDSE